MFLMVFCSNSAYFSDTQLVDGWTDRRTKGPTDGQPSYRDARTHLKIGICLCMLETNFISMLAFFRQIKEECNSFRPIEKAIWFQSCECHKFWLKILEWNVLAEQMVLFNFNSYNILKGFISHPWIHSKNLLYDILERSRIMPKNPGIFNSSWTPQRPFD